MKGANRQLRLAHLFLAVQGADILLAIFVLLGIEQVRLVPGLSKGSSLSFVHVPFSHSLFMTFLWAGLAYVLHRRYAEQGRSVAVSLAIISHYFLDGLVHVPDLPVWLGPGPARIGFSLWNYPVAEFLLEAILVIIGLRIYTNATVWRTRAGFIAPWAVGIFLLVLNLHELFWKQAANPTMLVTASLMTNLGMVAIAVWLDQQRG